VIPLAPLVDRLGRARRTSVLTGAGVSVASGVPTFRGPDGLWKNYRPEELATPAAFARDPHLVWDWYDWRRGVIAGCRPNRAHDVLAAWSRRLPGFALITQNVDGLHEAAGAKPLCLHGSIWDARCAGSCADGRTPWRDGPTSSRRCPHCGGLARPAVVWFGEPLDAAVLASARAATDCEVFLAVGTSAVVYPAAGLIHEARRRGAFIVEINPAPSDAADSVDMAVAHPAELVLDAVERELIGSA
jgi:NAD-dependent deacetylase